MEVFKFCCKNCNFKCNEKSKWDKHINTEKHKTGKNKIRSDYNGPYLCEICNYETKNKTMFKQHKLNYHSTNEEREKEFYFYCGLCDYGSFSKQLLDNHKLTKKHKRHEISNHK